MSGITPGLEYLSFSRIAQYRSCSLAWKFKYRDKIAPAFTPAALATGSAWHAGAAHGLQGLMAGSFSPVAEMIEIFAKTLTEIGATAPIQWGEKLDRDKAIEQARAMFEAWVAWKRPEGRVVAIEQDFNVELAPWLPRVTGRADLLEDQPDALVVVDLKSSASRWSEADVELRADQLVIYKEAFRNLAQELGKPIVAAFEVVTKTKTPTVERLYLRETDGAIDRQVKIATVVAEGVEREVFLPNPSWTCRKCPWREACRVW